MAIGVLFIARTPGYAVDLMSYLFGNILLVPREDLWLMAGLDAVLLLTVAVLRRPLLAVAFDEEFARLRGLPVTLLYLLLLCLVALTVVLLIRVVGLILVIALLTLPAAIAAQHATTLGRIMVLAVVLGSLFTTGGLALSYGPDLPAGATMILLAGVAYLVSTVVQRWLQRRRTHVPATTGGGT
jgi:zinc transport system permease protein